MIFIPFKKLLLAMVVVTLIQGELFSEPYIIYRRGGGAGFWSNFMVVLASIDAADQRGWIPVIDMLNHPTLYSETYPIDGTKNGWEYFFFQPGELSLEDAIKQKAKNNQGGADGVFSRATAVVPPQAKIDRARALIDKYIKIKPEVLRSVEALIPEYHDQFILGVHVRGTDRRKGAPGHLRTASAKVYLDKAIDLDALYHYDTIFLACDEKETVERFQAVFQERLLFAKAHRVSAHSPNTVHKIKDSSNPPRQHHKYLLGREVLIDALLLARCNHLLCGPSNVSHGAIYFAKEDPIIHELLP